MLKFINEEFATDVDVSIWTHRDLTENAVFDKKTKRAPIWDELPCFSVIIDLYTALAC